jgi:hypothetical protein
MPRVALSRARDAIESMRRVHSRSKYKRHLGNVALFVQSPTDINMGHREATGQRQ